MKRNWKRILAFCCVLISISFFMPANSASANTQYFTGNKTIDLNAMGYGTYDIYLCASTIVGGSRYAEARITYGNLVGNSYSYIGEASVEMYINDVERINSVWIASSIEVIEFDSDTEQSEHSYYYNFELPTSYLVTGYTYCEGYYNGMYGYIDGSGAPPNALPTVSTSVSGYGNGTMMLRNTEVTVSYKAADIDGNLVGIRYNCYNAQSGILDNNSGRFTNISGYSGTVIRTLTLSSYGDWYFWTEAVDSSGTVVSESQRYHLIVKYKAPSFEPAYWSASAVVGTNNCYNYSTNCRTDTYAIPGRAHDVLYNLYNTNTEEVCAQLIAAACADGLEYVADPLYSEYGKMLVALYLRPVANGVVPDFHWYRQDFSGLWSHKLGSEVPIGNLTSTSLDASSRGYTVFVGYFYVETDSQQGQGLSVIN